MIAEAVRYYTRENYYENRWKIRITKTQTVGYLEFVVLIIVTTPVRIGSRKKKNLRTAVQT